MVDQQEILPVNAFKTKIFAQKLASYIHGIVNNKQK